MDLLKCILLVNIIYLITSLALTVRVLDDNLKRPALAFVFILGVGVILFWLDFTIVFMNI